MRERVCLNGEWSFEPDFNGRNADEAVENFQWGQSEIMVPSSWRSDFIKGHPYQSYNIFQYPKEWDTADSGVIARKFAVDKKVDDRVFLKLNGVMQRSSIYINGINVVDSEEAFLPVEMDITDYVHNGNDNEVKVWCSRYERIQTEIGPKLLVPEGSCFGVNALGIWQDVFLEYRSPVHIQNMKVVTSVRKGSLKIDAGIMNGLKAFKGNVWAKVLDEGNIVQELYSEEVILGSGGQSCISISEQWADAKLWSPEQPHLYTVIAELIIDNNIVDTLETRFGFREFWIDGYKYYLNGKRINLRTDSWHYRGLAQQTKEYAFNWYKMCKDMGMNSIRLHAMPYPEIYLDAADEFGMIIIDESAIYGSSKAMRADHPRFIENCHKHLRSLIHRDQNHPSIVIWSMQNEMRWVDGREGYKTAMIPMIETMKALDDSRPISFDGDNRLVDTENMEIISMHYNIDGTIKDWDKSKPLAFGEHGKFHYVSPQVSTEFGGSEAYLSFERCMYGLGMEEKLFSEYARKEEVSGISPFNMANYMTKTMPKEDMPLSWDDITTPGVKPSVIIRHSLAINNGYVRGEPIYYKNPAWDLLHEAMKPVAIIADEYNTSFFEGIELERNFSIYNDTENDADSKLVYSLLQGDKSIVGGETEFKHLAGERKNWKCILQLPQVDVVQKMVLSLKLFHSGIQVDTLEKQYDIYPQSLKNNRLSKNTRRVAYTGDDMGYARMSGLLEGIINLQELSAGSLKGIDFVIIGSDYAGKLEGIQPLLQDFISRGGFVLVLEQTHFVPGDITLSGKKFYNTFISEKEHPIFRGLKDQDLQFWGPENIYADNTDWMIQNAFNKPVSGNFKTLLECGEGNFGWGGLLWTPLVEYAIGDGRLILNQIALTDNFETVPQASLLLRNLLEYGVKYVCTKKNKVGLLTKPGSAIEAFAEDLGLEYSLIDTNNLKDFKNVILDTDKLIEDNTDLLRQYAENGGSLMVMPLETKHEKLATRLCGMEVEITGTEVYQVKPLHSRFTAGITIHDLYHLEKATYSPSNKANEAICCNALKLKDGDVLFETVKNPWKEYFVNGSDPEPIKMAIAFMVEEKEFSPECCGIAKSVGSGTVLFSQLKTDAENEKLKRVYSRLMDNAGMKVDTKLLSYFKEEKDFGIPGLMALKYEKHEDYKAEEAYFADPKYILNNLGEGVYGWMKRVDKKEGLVSVPRSAGEIYFLTVFVDSDINRDPTRRANNELPDSSIVPDLFISTNASMKLFVNGECYLDHKHQGEEFVELKVDDVVLGKGINRIAMVCRGTSKDITFNICFKNKYGDYLDGLKYQLTMD